MGEVRRQRGKWKGSCFSGQVIITSHVICAFNLLCSISIAMVRVIGILSRTLGGGGGEGATISPLLPLPLLFKFCVVQPCFLGGGGWGQD